MYDFVDLPVARLGSGGRFLLWTMRGWIHSATAGGCPPGALAPAFARHGVLPALPHVHHLLGEIYRNARSSIAFLPPNYCRIGEDEAVLLQLWRDATQNPTRAAVTLGLLLEPEAVGTAFTALIAAVVQLAEGGLDTVATLPDGVTNPRR